MKCCRPWIGLRTNISGTYLRLRPDHLSHGLPRNQSEQEGGFLSSQCSWVCERVRAWLLVDTPSFLWDQLASSLTHSLSVASQAAAQWKQPEAESCIGTSQYDWGLFLGSLPLFAIARVLISIKKTITKAFLLSCFVKKKVLVFYITRIRSEL